MAQGPQRRRAPRGAGPPEAQGPQRRGAPRGAGPNVAASVASALGRPWGEGTVVYKKILWVLHIDISHLSTHVSRTPIYDRLNLS